MSVVNIVHTYNVKYVQQLLKLKYRTSRRPYLEVPLYLMKSVLVSDTYDVQGNVGVDHTQNQAPKEGNTTKLWANI